MSKKTKLEELQEEVELNMYLLSTGKVSNPFKIKIRKKLIKKLKKEIKLLKNQK